MTEWLYQIPTGKAWAYRDGKWLYAFGANQAVGYFQGDTVFSLPDGKPRFTLRSA